MILEAAVSNVFGSADVKLESVLKNPNQFKEAVLYEALSHLSNNKLKEFVSSTEAKTMVNENIITQDMLDRLANETQCNMLKTATCHMAKEENDPMWDELVQLRIQERRLINALIEKYGDKAKSVADNANKEFVEASIPKYFID